MKIGPDYVNLTCGRCGHTAGLMDFTRTPVGGELPRGVYQCPQCGLALERVQGRPEVTPSGFVLPGPVTVRRVPAKL